MINNKILIRLVAQIKMMMNKIVAKMMMMMKIVIKRIANNLVV